MLAKGRGGRNPTDVAPSADMRQKRALDMPEGAHLRYVALDRAVTDYVSSLFVLEVGAAGLAEPLQPDGGVVAFALAGTWSRSTDGIDGPEAQLTFGSLFGPTDRAVQITATPHARAVGMALTPLGWSQLVGLPANQLACSWRPIAEQFEESAELLEHLAGAPDEDVLTARLVRWVTRRMRLASAPDPHIGLIGAALDDPDVRSVEDVAAKTRLSVAMLERLCPGIFGFAPARLVERQRFLRALRRFQIQSLTQDVQDFRGDYPDAAAFGAAFREFMGQTVADYLASPPMMLMAGMRAAARLADEGQDRAYG